MEEKGLKQTDLAVRAFITQSAISKYVRGASEPKSRELHVISKALGVSMDSWFSGLPPADEYERDENWKFRAANAERTLREVEAAVLKYNQGKKIESSKK